MNEPTQTPIAAAVAAAGVAAFAKLSEYNFIICIDRSGSMGEPVKAGQTRTRWEAVQESAMSFCRDVEKIDDDGLDVIVFGGVDATPYQNVTSASIRDIFANNSPRGGTPLAEALKLATQVSAVAGKKKFVVVFTDGVPNDKDAAAKVIRDQSNRQQSDDECTFLFVQVGDDPEASKYLKMLDDDLKGAKFDIVDAKTVEEADKFASTAELVLHSIND